MDGTAAVDSYMDSLDHPFATELQTVRQYILAAHPRVTERIKWKSPSFHVGTDDLGAFELRPTGFLRLILVFPYGLVADPTGLMTGTWADRRELRFTSAADVTAKRFPLQHVVRDWVALLPESV
ncbi:hypothetical protein GCM10027413_16980 [Conyzicola nivalis]|uniref:YdhG-like domain-containing protein n=1 Tax=Conyzicola nivalis TaxID=1477021 RepID=A0A916SFY6_9MICO|nr:DUF1801 domain-containing protein [Conyzicola nivalis]GGA97252.1 hypothetical protein GCM10010979_09640 [Conyzicola nivalis]